MILANGDMNQYGIIKRGSVGDYLVKLNNYVGNIEREIEINKMRR